MQQLTIMITGASRGIGLTTAKILAKQGHRLALFSNEPMDDALADKVIAKANKENRLVYGLLDVTQTEDWDNAIEQIITTFGGVDVLINNAGILKSGNLAESDLAGQLLTVDVNCKGVLIGCQKIAQHLQGNQQSKIINLSSASAIYGQPEIANYSASKFYVRGLTEALNLEYGKRGIKVVDIMPLWVVSDMTKGVNVTSINRLGLKLSTKDVAKAIAKLVNKPNKKVCKTHYPIGMPAKFLNGLAQVTPDSVVRLINKQVAG